MLLLSAGSVVDEPASELFDTVLVGDVVVLAPVLSLVLLVTPLDALPLSPTLAPVLLSAAGTNSGLRSRQPAKKSSTPSSAMHVRAISTW